MSRMDKIRVRIKQRMGELNLSYREISLGLGMSHAYMQQFFTRNLPRRLPERIRYKLAEILQLPETELRDYAEIKYQQPAAQHGRALAETVNVNNAANRAAELTENIRRHVRKKYFANNGALDIEETYQLADTLIEHFMADALRGALPDQKAILKQAELLVKFRGKAPKTKRRA